MCKRSLLFLMIIGLFLSVSGAALALETEDTTPPEITLISPAPYQPFIAGGLINIDYIVKDNDGGSGILFSWWHLTGIHTHSGMSASYPTHVSLDADSYKFTVTAIDYAGNITTTEPRYIQVYEPYSQAFAYFGWLGDWPWKDKAFLELQYNPQRNRDGQLSFRYPIFDITFTSEGFDWVGVLFGSCAVQAHGKLQNKPGEYTIFFDFDEFNISKRNCRVKIWAGTNTSETPILDVNELWYHRGNEGDNQNMNDWSPPK